ncbi:hypothetical protein AYI68_g5581 [Smittium mucronatum]|uniref:Uncharacterized protein n=1 Tax=Smittium mucronatum TaxID=133383 RepID=A0A1R0GU09_9FUNG|nr:hypothetical protein AYI68_g5581 [Smittium mucronatum]
MIIDTRKMPFKVLSSNTRDLHRHSSKMIITGRKKTQEKASFNGKSQVISYFGGTKFENGTGNASLQIPQIQSLHDSSNFSWAKFVGSNSYYSAWNLRNRDRRINDN